MARRGRNPRINSAFARDAVYSRSVVCSLCGVSEYQLRTWEREELIVPLRDAEYGKRGEPLYDAAALERIRLIRTLGEELEVNLPGIEIILSLLERLAR